MQTKEALRVLGLSEHATQEEVKAAFRDLVKVWHPDRFGSDPRLREKAEQKLKDINDAYRVLRDGIPSEMDTESTQPYVQNWGASSWNTPTQTAKRHLRAGAILVYGLAGFFLLAMATYAFVLVRSVNQHASETPATVTAIPATPASFTNTKPASPASKHPRQQQSGLLADSSATSSFEVLSEGETAQVQSACARKRRDSSTYTDCMRTELARIRRYEATGSSLSTEEQDSLATACATEKSQNDTPGYARCVAFYKGELETAPDRPNMAALNVTDRNAAEAACVKSKAEGPSAYDRCLMRFVRLLVR